jgi:hypothetical protein
MKLHAFSLRRVWSLQGRRAFTLIELLVVIAIWPGKSFPFTGSKRRFQL